MNSIYEGKLPQWYKEQEDMDLVLSNDIDSLVACCLLKEECDWYIRYYYDFNRVFESDFVELLEHEKCWVDVAVLNGDKAFDNHVSMASVIDKCNENMINPNLLAGITNEDYTDKYAGSTALMVWSLYNRPLPSTEEGKMLLLCIDSAFKGYYSSRFTERNQFYLCDMFGMEELRNVLSRHTKEDFEAMIDRYNLRSTFELEDGKIKTDMNLEKIGKLLELNLELPEDVFTEKERYKSKTKKFSKEIYMVEDIEEDIFTLAFTHKNHVKYSLCA